MAKKKKKDKEKPELNPELDEFKLKINEFGEIKSEYDVDKINQFLNRNVDDKKLKDREDIDKGEDEESENEENKNKDE